MNIKIRQLNINDTKQFCNLIFNMFSNLNNLEWFSPMPFDKENVENMITNPRFYIVGYFVDNVLAGVSSLDYKCGKLIGKINLPEDCNTDKLVEIGFNLDHTDFRGQKIMQKLIDFLLEKLKNDGFEWVFSKVHKDNIASNKSFLNKGFEKYSKFDKPVKKEDFIYLSSQPFFCPTGKQNAENTLNKFKDNEQIIVDYNILIKKL